MLEILTMITADQAHYRCSLMIMTMIADDDDECFNSAHLRRHKDAVLHWVVEVVKYVVRINEMTKCDVWLLGSYSDSFGIDVARRDIAAYITQRDGGIPSDYNDVFLSTGASDGIKACLIIITVSYTHLTLPTKRIV